MGDGTGRVLEKYWYGVPRRPGTAFWLLGMRDFKPTNRAYLDHAPFFLGRGYLRRFGYFGGGDLPGMWLRRAWKTEARGRRVWGDIEHRMGCQTQFDDGSSMRSRMWPGWAPEPAAPWGEPGARLMRLRRGVLAALGGGAPRPEGA